MRAVRAVIPSLLRERTPSGGVFSIANNQQITTLSIRKVDGAVGHRPGVSIFYILRWLTNGPISKPDLVSANDIDPHLPPTPSAQRNRLRA